MTDSMKCPICGKDLIEIQFGKRWFLACDNSKCRCKGVASYVVWEYIDRTRKALDVAVYALKEYEDRDSYDCDGNWCGCEHSTAHKALTKITALEQKEQK